MKQFDIPLMRYSRRVRNACDRYLVFFAVSLSFIFGITGPSAYGQNSSLSKFPAYKHPITIWVPPYAIARSKAQLTGIAPQIAITHLALQFWVPTTTGGVKEVGFEEVNDGAITALRDWGHAHGIRVLLCVFNGADKWDWPLAKAAFADHPKEFATNLVTEMERLKLDGVDIDLEGPGDFDADRPAFVAFMTDLSGQLHARGKQLTVDSFPADKWNCPNQTWWPTLFPLVDALTTMGYESSGGNATDWGAYASQRKAAGTYTARLQIGMPSDKDTWKGNTALEQLQWVQKDGTMGIGIWDAQLPAPAWKTAPVWQAIRDIRAGKR